MLEHVVEIVGLHDHVVEFQKAQAALHALLVAFCAQHVVDREACADLAQQINIIERNEPFGIVKHQGLAVGEIDELLHLALETFRIVVDILTRQHLAHIGTAGRIADQRGTVANQGDGLVPRHLQTLHQAQRHEMTDMQ